ncbi:MAG: triose-phosphate isomerase [Pseudomonadota bacterium]
MKKMICAGNWKLNKNPEESLHFLSQLKESLSPEELKDFAVFMPALSLYTVAQSGVEIPYGPQNVFWQSEGAFTGENSADVAKGMGASLSLVGHSERRQIFGETSEQTAMKVQRSHEAGLLPVLCLGETLEQRESGQTKAVITEQLKKGTEGLDKSQPLWLAYEPVWAIGTGKVATPDQAEEAHAHLRSIMTELFGSDKANATPILYGGSVKPDNSGELSKQSNIDGFLIGGASLKVESFVQIYRNSQS